MFLPLGMILLYAVASQIGFPRGSSFLYLLFAPLLTGLKIIIIDHLEI